MAATVPQAVEPASAGAAWTPFRHRAFAMLWTATVVSNIGTWMHDVGAGWLMVTLAPSPLMVALVQAATTLPVFLLALPAGALADIVDRRRMLLLTQSFLLAVALALGVAAALGRVTPGLLLLFTFLGGVGAALTAPAWQAIVPELVPRPALQPAIALNSLGINIARAIGPALGGLVIALWGMAAPFLLNAASFVGVIAALAVWRRTQPAPARPERFTGAMRAGLRYAAASRPLQVTLVRAAAFFVFASCYWALLPLVARIVLTGGPGLYGLLLGCIGAGAVAGALVLPRVRAHASPDRIVLGGTAATAAAMAVLALVPFPVAAFAACAVAVAAWIAVLSSLNVSAQTALPNWVRARGLAIYLVVFFGSMTLGSLAWGRLAEATDIPAALLAAAAGALAAAWVVRHRTLPQGAGADLAPSMHWPAPVLAGAVEDDRGPVMVMIEYRIDPNRSSEFLDALEGLGRERRRDGAYRWEVFEDAAARGRYVEAFWLASWGEHLRQHERVTVADKDMQDRVRAFHVGMEPPHVTHLIAADRASARRG